METVTRSAWSTLRFVESFPTAHSVWEASGSLQAPLTLRQDFLLLLEVTLVTYPFSEIISLGLGWAPNG